MKKKTVDPSLWEEEEVEKEVVVEKPKKKRSGAYSKTKGNNYELKIIKELTTLGYDGLKSSRSESKSLDNDKIDIAQDRDAENELPFWVQCKCTKTTPNFEQIIKDCPRKQKPMAIFWNKQVNKEVNMGSAGQYVVVEKSYFYEMLNQINEKIN